MNPQHPTALLADDEPLLRKALARQLASAWPELEIVAQARNGREAVERFEALQPDVCFLDIHMPGLSGIEAAQRIGRRAHLVFVTAHDDYAVQAFEQGAIDYLVKPVQAERLAASVARLRERIASALPQADTHALIEHLLARLGKPVVAAPLRWIHASVGATVRLIAVDAIDFLRSDEKYTRIAWHDDAGKAAEALVRMPLKDLLGQLDDAEFVQVHRSVVVALRAISHVTRDGETAQVHLRQRSEVLPVSRSHLHRFRQM